MKKFCLVLLIFFCQLGFASVEDMQQKLTSLGEGKSFAFVSLDLSEDELQVVDQFVVDNFGFYDRFGDLHLITEELPDFLRSVGHHEEAIQKITSIISNAAEKIVEASQKETAWVTVRVSLPNSAFDIPRWHWDGYYYHPFSGLAHKFAAVLMGDTTLFYPLPAELREEFDQHRNEREFLCTLVEENQIQTAHFGQGAFFIVGDRDHAAVHSEPKMESPRIFFSIVTGTEDEINELKEIRCKS